ncbi:nuclear transport factor 2 family protein [Adhaeribacter soli]|uniref:Uncharacterized protein n=1 Tax=Adhaeribacter soli TaxID=2607655 RepID=A0A5N1J0D5_9BACT|nr:nuclear transport factor 2 family protein [Adhaeribacter soli]KAA9340165.1 hypothetical protein F0P94_07405 [Adhaeribacter soli]
MNFKHVFKISLLLLLGFMYLGFKPAAREKAKTDEQVLIELILHRGLVERDKVADYRLFKNKKKFYISRRVYESVFSELDADFVFADYAAERFPKRVGKIKIAALTEEELQKKADKKGDFLYLSISDIKIEGDRAQIGLSLNWKVSKNTKGIIHMSGGGYILEYVKENGQWKFNRELRNWIS